MRGGMREKWGKTGKIGKLKKKRKEKKKLGKIMEKWEIVFKFLKNGEKFPKN